MKLSDILYESVKKLWEEAADKPFVRQMAKGSLDRSRFRYYMIQDYMYLQDYIELLDKTLQYTDDPELKTFMITVIEETKQEAKRVHEKYFESESMQSPGSDSSIDYKKDPALIKDPNLMRDPNLMKGPVLIKEPVLIEYVEYMQKQLEGISEEGDRNKML